MYTRIKTARNFGKEDNLQTYETRNIIPMENREAFGMLKFSNLDWITGQF